MDPHQNIFYFYRAQVKEKQGIILDTQLENNTTKALYNVLEHSEDQVLRSFIKNFLKLTPPRDIDTVQFALQKRDIHRPDIERRLLLTICGVQNDEAQQISKDISRAGLPDGWIWCKDWVVLNENKLSQKLTDAQLRRHMKGAEGWWWKNNPKRHRRSRRTWKEVHEFFNGLRGLNEQSQFLVKQFVDYLEWISMVKTWKLKEADFAFFTAPEEERDPTYRKLVTSKMRTLMEELENMPGIRKLKKRYNVPREDRKAGQFAYFGKGADWFSFRPEYSKECTHFSFYLSESDVHVELFSPYKSFTEFALRKIRDSKNEFLQMMKRVGKDTRGRHDQWFIQETPYWNPGSAYKGKSIDSDSLRPVFSVHPSFLRREIVDQALLVAESLLKKKDIRPEFKLSRSFSRSAILNDGDIRRELQQTVSDFLPYLDFFSKHRRRVAKAS